MNSLFDLAPAARTGQITQQAAAASVAYRAPSMREKVLAYIKARTQGATNEEISDALKMKIQTVCGRVNELQKLNAIEWRGELRATESGVQAKVWRVKGAA